MTLNNTMLPVLSELLWKNILSGQTADMTRIKTHLLLRSNKFPFVFLKKSSSCRLKISGHPPVSSQWHRDLTLLRTSLASGKLIKRCDTACVGSQCIVCEGGSGAANTSQQCNQSQRTCSAHRRSALGVPWAVLRSEPLR